MNHFIPDWNSEGDLPASNQKKPMGLDHELVELLWRNGQVVLHSQTHRKPSLHDPRLVEKHDPSTLRFGSSIGNSSNFIQDDETASWIQYPLEDFFEKEFCSNLFAESPSSDHIVQEKLVKLDASHVVATSQQQSNNNNSKHPVFPEHLGNQMSPPRIQTCEHNHYLGGFDKSVNANSSEFSSLLKGDLRSSSGQFGGKGSGNLGHGEIRECSMMTVGSSNQIPNDPNKSQASSNGVGTTSLFEGPHKGGLQKVFSQKERGKTETLEPTVTSSSGGSGSSFDRTCKQSTGIISHKRKSMDTEESECQSEAAELISAAANNPAKKSGSARRSRSAEVHNLSERRRRDRINEKMRALQELIPHCNKMDKASMLDEAIEYLKSLQLQLQVFQVMWMGSGMAPVMFPGVQHCISHMGMGMGPPPLPSIHNPMHLSRVPLVDQSMSMSPAHNQAVICQSPMLNPVNYQNQLQNLTFSDQYAHVMGFQMQNTSQPMNMFRFGPQTIQQNQTMAPPSSSGGPLSGGTATADTSLSGKTG